MYKLAAASMKIMSYKCSVGRRRLLINKSEKLLEVHDAGRVRGPCTSLTNDIQPTYHVRTQVEKFSLHVLVARISTFVVVVGDVVISNFQSSTEGGNGWAESSSSFVAFSGIFYMYTYCVECSTSLEKSKHPIPCAGCKASTGAVCKFDVQRTPSLSVHHSVSTVRHNNY